MSHPSRRSTFSTRVERRADEFEQESLDQQTSLLTLAYEVLGRYWRSIVAITVVGILLALGVTALTPQRYRATMLYFASTSVASNNTGLQADEFARRRVPSYPLLVQSDLLVRRVLTDSGVQMSVEDLKGALTAQVEPDTVLLRISVTDSSPDRVRAIAESMTRVLPEVISQVDSNDRTSQGNIVLKLISGPTQNDAPVSPNGRLNLALGGLLGLALALFQAITRAQVRRATRR